MSVSGLAPFTSSAFSSVLRKAGKSGSLIKCQTWAMDALMTADSETVGATGGADDEDILFVEDLPLYAYE